VTEEAEDIVVRVVGDEDLRAANQARLAQAGTKRQEGGPLLLAQLRDELIYRAGVRGAGSVPDLSAQGGELDEGDPLVRRMPELLNQSGLDRILDQTGDICVRAPEAAGQLSEGHHFVVAHAPKQPELGWRDPKGS
jgi:hypothetical protein